MNKLPLHVIIKQLANTSWSKLDEELLRKVHVLLQNTTITFPLRQLTLPKYVPSNVSGKFSDLDVTYTLEDVGLLKPAIEVDEVFLDGTNITSMLSKKAMEDIEYEVMQLLQREEDASEILTKVGD